MLSRLHTLIEVRISTAKNHSLSCNFYLVMKASQFVRLANFFIKNMYHFFQLISIFILFNHGMSVIKCSKDYYIIKLWWIFLINKFTKLTTLLPQTHSEFFHIMRIFIFTALLHSANRIRRVRKKEINLLKKFWCMFY